MTLMSPTHFEYCCTLLEDLQEKNIRYKLVDGIFRMDAKAENATPELIKWIGHHRESLTLAVARQQRLCLVCRRNSAQRPHDARPYGYRDWCEECWQKLHAPALMQTALETKTSKQKEKVEEQCPLLI